MLVNTLLLEGFAVLSLTNEDLQLHTAFQLHQKLLFRILIDGFGFLVGTGNPKRGLYFRMSGVFVCQYWESFVLAMVRNEPQVDPSHTILFSKIITNYQG